MLSPIAWRTPPHHYGPWESVVSSLTEELVAGGIDVTLFATGDSRASGELSWVCPRPYSEDPSLDPKVWECLHIAEVFERAGEFDLIHNHFDFLPLTYSKLADTPVVTTIHGFSSAQILPVYKKYNDLSYYVAISEADKNPELDYLATIHHGINLSHFSFHGTHEGYLLVFGRIHPDKGVREAIEVAKRLDKRLIIAGIIHDEEYFKGMVQPHIDGERITYLGSVGPDRRSAVLGGASALLHLINFDEPFGLSLIESMACGTPVIAIGRGAIPEIVEHGETGFLVNNVDEAVQAVDKIDTLDRSRCREAVEQRFTASRMAQDYLNVYQKMLDRRENYRPWGHYQNLAEGRSHKVKELFVAPGQRLSLQKHRRRAEHWTVVAGQALVTVDNTEVTLCTGDSIDIPRGATHRVLNPGDETTVIVETQMGDYFGEDDIIRVEDDYGRA
ncbi:MAG: glycosyltransferase [Gammaproteobacteria bacterium]|nr:glycosyltransferase [Gammaproteobacteria bacterium]